MLILDNSHLIPCFTYVSTNPVFVFQVVVVLIILSSYSNRSFKIIGKYHWCSESQWQGGEVEKKLEWRNKTGVVEKAEVLL